MAHFTEEQLKELEAVFDLQRRQQETWPIWDGRCKMGDEIWWMHQYGPQLLTVNAMSISNIREYPKLYSHSKPKVKAHPKVQYVEEERLKP